MTISSTIRRAGPFEGNGVTDTLPFTFRVLDENDLRVILANELGIESDLQLHTDYAIIFNPDQEATPGGNIVLTTPLGRDKTITITSAAEYLQPTKITNMGGFYPAVFNDALDRLTIFAQQLSEQIARAVKVKISSNTNPEELIATLEDAMPIAVDAASRARTSADVARQAENNLIQGLGDLAGVKQDMNDLKLEMTEVVKAIVPATAEEIKNGVDGKLVDAAGLKEVIPTAANLAGEGLDAHDGKLKVNQAITQVVLYPGGTSSNPPTLTTNTRIIIDNPLGTIDDCFLSLELFYNGQWAVFNQVVRSTVSGTTSSFGVYASLIDKKINIQTGGAAIFSSSSVDGNPFGTSGSVSSVGYRLRVTKLGGMSL